jgi:hypothetical protein
VGPYHLHVPIVYKFWSFNLQEPQGPVQACGGKSLPLPYMEWDVLGKERGRRKMALHFTHYFMCAASCAYIYIWYSYQLQFLFHYQFHVFSIFLQLPFVFYFLQQNPHGSSTDLSVYMSQQELKSYFCSF